MGLPDLVAHALRGVAGKLRRNAIAYSICGICALAILVLATGAGVLALVPLVGAVYALLIAAGVYLAVIVGTMMWLQLSASRPAVRVTPMGAVGLADNASSTQRQMQFAQLAMIVEAVLLGYSLSRKR